MSIDKSICNHDLISYLCKLQNLFLTEIHGDTLKQMEICDVFIYTGKCQNIL